MTDIQEFDLPGVGVRYEFTTQGGRRLALVSHRSGRKEIFCADARDPDSFRPVLALGDDDAHTLAEMLGGSRITQHLTKLQQRIEGLAIDWLPVRPGSPYVGRTIGDARVRTRTGVSIVAVLRGDDPYPAPGPEFELAAADYLVVVGTARGIEDVVTLLHDG
ncbi:cation:proton antiporter regulatory subunit [soil metagenome]